MKIPLFICGAAVLMGILFAPVKGLHFHPDTQGWIFLVVVAVLIVGVLASAFWLINDHFRREEERIRDDQR